MRLAVRRFSPILITAGAMTAWERAAVAQLEAAVRAAFPVQPVPGPDCYAPSEGPQFADVCAAYLGRPWPQVAAQVPVDERGWPSGVIYLGPAAFRYYLPAFLLAAAARRCQPRDPLLTALLDVLHPADEDEWVGDWFEVRFEPLGPAQVRAILAFLELVETVGTATRPGQLHAALGWQRARLAMLEG